MANECDTSIFKEESIGATTATSIATTTAT
jgi:hypothetical protein